MKERVGRVEATAVLGLGLVAVSLGAILVRFSQEAPSLSIAFYRMAGATVLLTPAFLLRSRSTTPQYRRWDGPRFVAGLALALHFAFWIASLRFTSVAVSVLLVNTSPLFVACTSHLFLGEKLTRRGALGLGATLLGTLFLALGDIRALGDWRGTVLALAGAVALAAYLLAGRHIRQSSNLISYVYPTYSIAAITLLLLALLSGSELSGFSSRTYGFLLLLGLIPQAIGHTSYNWSLRYLPATSVSTLILGEPILATLFAWWILYEPFQLHLLPGAVLVMTGIFAVVSGGVRQDRPAASAVPDGLPPGSDFTEVAVVIPENLGAVWARPRREGGLLDRLLEFPGGKLAQGESPIEAARRELREEVGISVPGNLLTPLVTTDHTYPDRRLRLHFYRWSVVTPDDLPPDGAWYSLEHFIRNESWPEANTRALELLRQSTERESKPRP